MTRRVAFRPEMRRTMLDALMAGATYRAAAESSGIPWRTWCTWAKLHRDGGHTDPDVDGLVEAARQAYSKATTAIVAQVRVASQKDWRAGAFLLEHRRGDPKAAHDVKRAKYEAKIAEKKHGGEYVERVEMVSAADIVNLPVEDLRAIARGEQPPGAGSSTP